MCILTYLHIAEKTLQCPNEWISFEFERLRHIGKNMSFLLNYYDEIYFFKYNLQRMRTLIFKKYCYLFNVY